MEKLITRKAKNLNEKCTGWVIEAHIVLKGWEAVEVFEGDFFQAIDEMTRWQKRNGERRMAFEMRMKEAGHPNYTYNSPIQ